MRARTATRCGAAVAALAIAALLGFAPPAPRAAPALDLGQAPRFRLEDLEGHALELETLRKKGPVVLDFWATWCKPCQTAMPGLEGWRKKYGPRGLTIVGISVDGPRNHGKVRPFVQRVGIHFPIAIDLDGRVQQVYQVVALPTTVLIDTAGNVVTSRIGYKPGEEKSFEARIAALLPAAPDSTAPPDSTTH